jgi:hypothetical protein
MLEKINEETINATNDMAELNRIGMALEQERAEHSSRAADASRLLALVGQRDTELRAAAVAVANEAKIAEREAEKKAARDRAEADRLRAEGDRAAIRSQG